MISLMAGRLAAISPSPHTAFDAVSRALRIAKGYKAATMGVVLTGIMRIFLFLGVLGVVTAGNSLDMANPAASVFQIVGQDRIPILRRGIVVCGRDSIIGCAYEHIVPA